MSTDPLVPSYLEKKVRSILPSIRLTFPGTRYMSVRNSGVAWAVSPDTLESTKTLDTIAEMIAWRCKQHGYPAGSFVVYVKTPSPNNPDPFMPHATVGVAPRHGIRFKRVYA